MSRALALSAQSDSTGPFATPPNSGVAGPLFWNAVLFANEELLDACPEEITGSRRQSRRVHPRRAQSFMPLSPQEKRERRAAQRNADAHAHDAARGQRRPRGREPGGCYWDPRPGEATGTWRKLDTHEPYHPAERRSVRAKSQAHAVPVPHGTVDDAAKLLGRFVKAPRAGLGGERAASTASDVAMVVDYGATRFKLKFPDDASPRELRVSWAQLLGAEPWGATRMHTLELQPVRTVSSRLMAKPDGKKPRAADCWDMRRGEWVDCTGRAVTAMTRFEANRLMTARRQDEAARRAKHLLGMRRQRSLAVAGAERSWLIDGRWRDVAPRAPG